MATGGEEPSSKVILISSDDQKFEVDLKAIRHSVTISTMIKDLENKRDSGVVEMRQPIPIPTVRGEVLEKVIEFCEHYKDVELIMAEEHMGEREIPEWDMESLKVDISLLFDLILAANYLDIKALSDNASRTIANMLKGKSSDEMREMLEIEDDFTPEEREEIRAENEQSP